MLQTLARLLTPTYRFDAIELIRHELLLQDGIRGLIMDLDDTLTLKNSEILAEPVKEWLKIALEMGFQCKIVSNNRYPEHVNKVSTSINIPAIARARKPDTKYLLEAKQEMSLQADQIVVIGDRLLTDVVGGSRLGMKTCLLTPINQEHTRLWQGIYWLERQMIRWLQRFG